MFHCIFLSANCCTIVTTLFLSLYPLDLHIGAEISPVGLPHLPGIKVHLDIADMIPGREKQVCEVVAALQPPKP